MSGTKNNQNTSANACAPLKNHSFGAQGIPSFFGTLSDSQPSLQQDPNALQPPLQGGNPPITGPQPQLEPDPSMENPIAVRAPEPVIDPGKSNDPLIVTGPEAQQPQKEKEKIHKHRKHKNKEGERN